MKRAYLALLISAWLGGCDQQPRAEAVSEQADTIAERKHGYVMRDGQAYGYLPALSANDLASGQVAPSLVMARYLGERDGSIQIALAPGPGKPGQLVQCQRPCEFAKVSTWFDGRYRNPGYLKAVPGSVIHHIVQDVLAGELERYIRKEQMSTATGTYRKGKEITTLTTEQYHVWSNEHGGQEKTLIHTETVDTTDSELK